MFKDYFKYYKRKHPPPKFDDVLDLENLDVAKVMRVPAKQIKLLSMGTLGLKPVESWEILEFFHIPGLIFIKNPFTRRGQRFWITKCLKDYSQKPNKLNIDAHNLLENNETWWDVCTRDTNDNNQRAQQLIPKLRWATLGYHHNWDTKHYSEDSKTSVPDELVQLSRIFTEMLGFTNFNPEAVIINYYRMNSTLAGHVDHSEVNMEAPLLSISFGQRAIFLIGGLKPEDPAQPIFVNSGDVVVMSGSSRLKYHGVPRVLPAQTALWDMDNLSINDENDEQECILIDENDWSKAKDLIAGTRINVNVRQVLKTGQSTLLSNE